MIYIGFSKNTNKLLSKILCHKFRHCAPILINNNKCIIYQFVKYKQIRTIPITKRDLKILKQYGWDFIKMNKKQNINNAIQTKPKTCVQFTKTACNIKCKRIQTPYSLYKYLMKK